MPYTHPPKHFWHTYITMMVAKTILDIFLSLIFHKFQEIKIPNPLK